MYWADHFERFHSERGEEGNYQNEITLSSNDYLEFFHGKVRGETEQFKGMIGEQYLKIASLREELEALRASECLGG